MGFPPARKKILEDGNPIIEKMILNNGTPVHNRSSRSAKDEVERDVPPSFLTFENGFLNNGILDVEKKDSQDQEYYY